MIINGKSIRLKTIEISDAQAILDLRSARDARVIFKNTATNLETQAAWIHEYKQRERVGKDYYFMIQYATTHESIGTIRLYDIETTSFRWGTWIVKDGSPLAVAPESAMVLYCFAFYDLKLEESRFEVWNNNKPVLKFHVNCGSQIVSQDEQETHFVLPKSVFEDFTRKKYGKFLPPLPLNVSL